MTNRELQELLKTFPDHYVIQVGITVGKTRLEKEINLESDDSYADVQSSVIVFEAECSIPEKEKDAIFNSGYDAGSSDGYTSGREDAEAEFNENNED